MVKRFLGLIFILLPAACTPFTPAVSLPTPAAAAPDLLIEEYAVVESGVDQPDHFEFLQRIPKTVFERRSTWRNPTPVEAARRQNLSLQKFGYELRPANPGYQMLQSGLVVQDEIAWFRPVSVNQSRDDFALLVETRHGRTLLIQRGRIYQWTQGQDFSTSPVYVGDELFYARWENGKVYVRREEEDIYSLAASGGVDVPLKGFHAWGNHWVLEVNGEVIMDEANMNRLMGLERIFNWQLIDGQPFFFFEKSTAGRLETGMFYAGWDMGYRYDEVIHYKCCEPAAFNAGGNETMAWFFARRDGKWYYVEAGVYQ